MLYTNLGLYTRTEQAASDKRPGFSKALDTVLFFNLDLFKESMFRKEWSGIFIASIKVKNSLWGYLRGDTVSSKGLWRNKVVNYTIEKNVHPSQRT